jgi:hypothetical protein
MTVNIKVDGENKYNLIIAHGPNKDENVEIKDTFFKEIHKTIHEATGENIILGVLNGREGNKSEVVENIIGRNGEETVNDNGRRLLIKTMYCKQLCYYKY